MRRFIIVLLSIFILLPLKIKAEMSAYKPNTTETLHYKVLYKWGLINKVAGNATLTLRPRNEGGFTTTLTAASAPWADKFYMVRDTLRGHLSSGEWAPTYYEKIAWEGDDHKHDKVIYTRHGENVSAECQRMVWDKKGNLKIKENRLLEATGTTMDMLTSFFYMRSLPYQNWQKGHEISVNLFSGKEKETLTIRYNGMETININGDDHDCYYITFVFTSKGGKKSSDNMDAWISANHKRIPLKLEGKLPVGKVHCIYEP